MNITSELITLAGAPGSPYTRKLLAVLRYRRLPYRWITRRQVVEAGLPSPKVPLMPTVWRPGPNGVQPHTDTTPLIRTFEAEFPGRGVIPADPVMAMVDALVEDYADEWLTKAMFHYRWVYQKDIDQSTAMLPLWFDPHRPDDVIKKDGKAFAERQIGRLHVVGSSPATASTIEDSFRRFLKCLDAHLVQHRFLAGARPGAADFAVFGQLTQLATFDPTPMALTLSLAPRVYAWVTFVEDLTGIEPEEADWFTNQSCPDSVRTILSEIGRTYVPVMLENARAAAAGHQSFSLDLNGAEWTQRTFPYQAKCVRRLREAFSALDGADQSAVLGILDGTGCEALFAGA